MGLMGLMGLMAPMDVMDPMDRMDRMAGCRRRRALPRPVWTAASRPPRVFRGCASEFTTSRGVGWAV